MIKDLTVRKSLPEDKTDYVAMNLEFMDFIRNNNPYWEELKKPDSLELGERFEGALKKPDNICIYIIEVDGKVAGFSNTWQVYSIWAGGMTISIDDLYIRQEYRGIGAGKGFFDYLSGWGRENKFKRIQLIGEVFNEPAARFYKNYGFSSETSEFFMYLL